MMSKNIYNFFFLTISLFTTGFFFAQTSVSGKITDSKTNKDLIGVTIFINDKKTPILNTKTAQFNIVADTIIYKIRFERKNYSAYETNSIEGTLDIKLSQDKESAIAEVVIKNSKQKYKSKKENPAYAIMQEVWKRKRDNGLEKFNSYRYKEYEKIQFDANNIDSAFMNRKVFNKLDFIFEYADSTANGKMALPVFLNESIYENYGVNQPTKKTKKLLIAQKTSGFQDNKVVAITAKNVYRDIHN